MEQCYTAIRLEEQTIRSMWGTAYRGVMPATLPSHRYRRHVSLASLPGLRGEE